MSIKENKIITRAQLYQRIPRGIKGLTRAATEQPQTGRWEGINKINRTPQDRSAQCNYYSPLYWSRPPAIGFRDSVTQCKGKGKLPPGDATRTLSECSQSPFWTSGSREIEWWYHDLENQINGNRMQKQTRRRMRNKDKTRRNVKTGYVEAFGIKIQRGYLFIRSIVYLYRLLRFQSPMWGVTKNAIHSVIVK